MGELNMFERKTKTPTILRVLHDNAWSPTDRKDSWIGKGGGGLGNQDRKGVVGNKLLFRYKDLTRGKKTNL